MKKYISVITLFITHIIIGQNYFTDTKGELAISASGQASYNLPIALPPSIHNVAPVINLSYTSGTMGGVAGQGWHINSLSNISRISTRLDIDGFIDGVDFDDNDKLALDGQRLILKSGAYWENGSTYETEIKSNTKIELFGQPGNIYFVVTQPDGARSWYGSTGSGNSISSLTSWYLVRFEDAHTNYIKYNYENMPYTGSYQSVAGAINYVATTQYYIKSIEFSGNVNANVPLTNKIDFIYRESPMKRRERAFIKGQYSYAFKLLEGVKVYTEGTLFKSYVLTHQSDLILGYERLKKIQEFNSEGEPANPIEFTYNTTPDSSVSMPTDYVNNLLTKDVKTSGDFDGDGKIDFVTSGLLYKDLFSGLAGTPPTILPAVAAESRCFAATTLNGDKINQFQSLVYVNETQTQTSFKVYNSPGSTIGLSYTKTIDIDNAIFHDTFRDQYNVLYSSAPGDGYNFCINNPSIKLDTKYFDADYNGDGLSEVLIAMRKNVVSFQVATYVNSTSSEPDAYYCLTGNDDDGKEFYMVNLDPNASSTLGTKDYVKLENTSALEGLMRYVMDFNGDGKADVLSLFPDWSYKVVGFKQLNQAPWIETEILGEGYMYAYAADKLILFGDYNGDGKTDVMIPGAIGSATWYIYYSNPKPEGGSFFNVEMHSNMLVYEPREHPEYVTQGIYNEYYAADINKDGKTDLVRFHKRTYEQGDWHHDSWNSEYYYHAMVNNIGNPNMGNTFTNYYVSPLFESGIGTLPVTIGANPKNLRMNQDFIMLWNDNKIHYISFTKDVRKDNRLISVSEAGGAVTQDVEYKDMEALTQDMGTPTDFYSSTNSATYPFVELVKSENPLVSKVTATINGISKFQKFKYHGFVVNLRGLGAIGFKRTARTGWYLNENDQKIWTIQNTSQSLRGATDANWTNTNEASLFLAEPDNLLSKKINTFSSSTSQSGVFNVLLESQYEKDYQTGIVNNTIFTYDPDDYGLQISSVKQSKVENTLQGLTTIETQYENNPSGIGADYFIGRPKQVNSSIKAYQDTRTAEEKYFYTGPDLVRTEKKGHQTDALVAVMTHDDAGNVLTKTVSVLMNPALQPRVVSDIYDPTMRFVTQKVDHQGFSTILEYNRFGLVKKSTDHKGVISEFEYDGWGKLSVSLVTGLSIIPKSITYTYERDSDGGYSVQKNAAGTNEMDKTFHDVSGNVVKTTTKGFANNSTISQMTEFDGLGRKIRVSEPYFSNPERYTEITYDYLHRPILITGPILGKIQTFDYSHGLKTITVTDGKQATVTVDALGNKIRTTDPGGTIDYKYFANGAPRQVTYGEHEIKYDIDGWGNKVWMLDPNAGVTPYTYSYDEFGQLKKEVTPKGLTEYTYDDFGKLIGKKVSGDGADFNTDYTYNGLALLENEVTKKTNGDPVDTFLYSYDTFNRLSGTTEINNHLEHNTSTTFDDYGRPDIETNDTRELATNFTATTNHQYNYNTYNGVMYKITDSADNSLIWQLNAANEKMQEISASYGNGVSITNQYTNSFLTRQVHKKNTIDYLAITYDYDFPRGNLTHRQNLAMGFITEDFTYDKDRLVSWTNPVTGDIDGYNGYDDQGRITVNNKLGTYSYNGPGQGIYQRNDIRLNASGIPYYSQLGGTQAIEYTMFKTPISINESNKGKINFEYNSHHSRSKMKYDYGIVGTNTIKVQRKEKLYTDDGTVEVIYNDPAQTITIRTFVGGDSYGVILYNEKTIEQSTGVITEGKYYLHRDNLGSILAISNDDGLLMERRHFDPWGNLFKITDIAGVSLPVVNGLQFLDRGYTSHEHLQEVRLIHMNGRLYDPVLRSMLMPDNFVQDPENTQNYNRYSYVMNNPLKYSDPSGESYIEAAIIGAAIAVAAYLVTNYVADQPINCSGVLKSTATGAISGAASYGIGQLADYLSNNFYVISTLSAAMHGTLQGTITSVSGGSFWTGFASGAISSLAMSAWSGGESTSTSFQSNFGLTQGRFVTETIAHGGISGAIGVGQNAIAMVAFGSVVAGATAELTGGNFWQGAAIGLTVGLLNHAMHGIYDEIGDPPTKGKKAPNLKAANKHFRKNTDYNSEYEVDAATVDLNFLDPSKLPLGEKITISTLFNSEHGRVFGQLDIIYRGNNRVEILPNRYDFEQKDVNFHCLCTAVSASKMITRNAFTYIGKLNAGKGTSFMFKFKGLNTIKPRPAPSNWSHNAHAFGF